jgi:hypothetical protein
VRPFNEPNHGLIHLVEPAEVAAVLHVAKPMRVADSLDPLDGGEQPAGELLGVVDVNGFDGRGHGHCPSVVGAATWPNGTIRRVGTTFRNFSSRAGV